VRTLDPVVKLLTGLVIFFVFALFLAEWWFKSDGQFYQTLAGLATTASGGLMLRITGKQDPHLPPLGQPPEPPSPADVTEETKTE
jgi:hypothetical protein